ncbi:hypothetical protein MKK55_15745 [Methylobacterium sp. J-059]|uniref:hypothetical protein n=1 Tax=Methylobacterium sp. J-059 TaxID=2836643 RepID=UPI001FB953C0|nr:hypothetical protein [Methylobacterium sp. J-059]MCJ2040386.1 hypothetical protein [Methylobacterium sp. J-059]
MPSYTLRRFERPQDGRFGVSDDACLIEARDEQEAILMAQAEIAEPDSPLLAIELLGRVIA